LCFEFWDLGFVIFVWAFRFCVLDFGFWVLSTGHWLLTTANFLLPAAYCLMLIAKIENPKTQNFQVIIGSLYLFSTGLCASIQNT